MKKVGFFTVLMLLAICCGAAYAAPKLVVEEPAFDFGEILKGDQVKHVFKISNGGDAPLTIEKVKTSCGCTAALLSEKVLAPGQAADVKTNFDSTRFQGAIHKTVYLTTDDPDQPEYKLYLTGKVHPLLKVEPDPLRLGMLTPGKAVEEKVKITNYGKMKVRLLKVTETSKDIEAKVSAKEVLPGQSVDVLIKATPAAGAERVGGYVVILTDSNTERITIQVYGKVAAK